MRAKDRLPGGVPVTLIINLKKTKQNKQEFLMVAHPERCPKLSISNRLSSNYGDTFEKIPEAIILTYTMPANQPTVSVPVDVYEVSSEIPQFVIIYSQEKIHNPNT